MSRMCEAEGPHVEDLTTSETSGDLAQDPHTKAIVLQFGSRRSPQLPRGRIYPLKGPRAPPTPKRHDA